MLLPCGEHTKLAPQDWAGCHTPRSHVWYLLVPEHLMFPFSAVVHVVEGVVGEEVGAKVG